MTIKEKYWARELEQVEREIKRSITAFETYEILLKNFSMRRGMSSDKWGSISPIKLQ